ncbi:MAG: hypothetical protein ACO3YQ_01660 [Flavobacteriales bacterium]
MAHTTPTATPPVLALSAVWAFGECALGGIQHALKIPFTGITVGGVAVAVLTVLAAWCRGLYTAGEAPGRTFSTLLTATGYVLAAKALASPHSPPMAFVAVGFQGLLAAVLFSTVRPFRTVALLFAVLAMLESAGQKFLVLTLLFGASWWDASTALLDVAARALGSSGDDVGLGLLLAYLGLYAVWGAFLGWTISGAPARFTTYRAALLERWHAHTPSAAPLPSRSGRTRPHALRGALATLIGIVLSTGILALTGTDTPELLRIVLRTLAASILLFLVVGPALRAAVHRLSRRPDTRASALFLVDSLASTADRWAFCRTFAAERHTRPLVRLYFSFEYLIHLSLAEN